MLLTSGPQLPPHLGKPPSRPSSSSSRPHQLSQSTSPHRSSSASSLELNEEKEKKDELGAPPSRPYSPSEDHLHPPADSSVVDEPRARSPHVIRHQTSRPSHRPFLPTIDSAEEITALPEMQAEPHAVRRRTRLQKKDRPKSKDNSTADVPGRRTSVQLSGEEVDFIFDRMQGRAWRRRGYIFGNLLLWALWTVTFGESTASYSGSDARAHSLLFQLSSVARCLSGHSAIRRLTVKIPPEPNCYSIPSSPFSCSV